MTKGGYHHKKRQPDTMCLLVKYTTTFNVVLSKQKSDLCFHTWKAFPLSFCLSKFCLSIMTFPSFISSNKAICGMNDFSKLLVVLGTVPSKENIIWPTYVFLNFLVATLESTKRGAWVAQLVKHLTLDFGSGHHLTVCGIEPYCRVLPWLVQSLLGILSLPLSLPIPHLLTCALSLSLSKYFKKIVQRNKQS